MLNELCVRRYEASKDGVCYPDRDADCLKVWQFRGGIALRGEIFGSRLLTR